MPDPEGNQRADDQDVPESSLHAYKDGRKDEISGDADALESNDPGDQQASTLEGEDEPGPPKKQPS
jgi:hypothetical protein